MTHSTNTNNPIDFPKSEFDQDCIAIYGKPLKGVYKHYCVEWDFLPIDETLPEFEACLCVDSDRKEIKSKLGYSRIGLGNV